MPAAPEPRPEFRKPKAPKIATGALDSSSLDLYVQGNPSPSIQGNEVVGVYMRPTGVDINRFLDGTEEHLATYRFECDTETLRERFLDATAHLDFHELPEQDCIFRIFYSPEYRYDIEDAVEGLQGRIR